MKRYTSCPILARRERHGSDALNIYTYMNIEIFSLCDYAADHGNGKLNVIGTFDTVNAPLFPFQLPHCAVAARLRIGNHESGNHNFEIKFMDAEAQPIQQSIKGQMAVMQHPTNDYSTINAAVIIGGLTFKKPGKYAVELHWDGEFQSGLTINVMQVQGMQRAA